MPQPRLWVPLLSPFHIWLSSLCRVGWKPESRQGSSPGTRTLTGRQPLAVNIRALQSLLTCASWSPQCTISMLTPLFPAQVAPPQGKNWVSTSEPLLDARLRNGHGQKLINCRARPKLEAALCCQICSSAFLLTQVPKPRAERTRSCLSVLLHPLAGKKMLFFSLESGSLFTCRQIVHIFGN